MWDCGCGCEWEMFNKNKFLINDFGRYENVLLMNFYIVHRLLHEKTNATLEILCTKQKNVEEK